MKIIVFGATGRVGGCLVRQALSQGHEVTAFVRKRDSAPDGALVVQGDATDLAGVAQALKGGFDAVAVCVGSRALKPSRVVTETMSAVIAGMQAAGITRLAAVSGTAEMPEKTLAGRLYTALLRRTPVGHAVRDHDDAFTLAAASGLSWVLAGCNYIANGPAKGRYVESGVFPGGFKTIHPGDVADFLFREIVHPTHHQTIVGLWYGRAPSQTSVQRG